jgi:biotin carboxyl carrier protein
LDVKNFYKVAVKHACTAIIVGSVLATSAPLASAANSAGGKCTKAGATVKSGKSTLKCTKVGKKLVWVAQTSTGSGSAGSASSGTQPTSQRDIPAIIQNWGFNFTDYSAATGKAGDMLIKGVTPPTFTGPTAASDNAMYRKLIGPIGDVVQGMVEPQYGFYLPLGTPVISMVTGTVCDVPKLYSNDYSVRVAPPGMACMQGGAYVLYEHEHILNPTVKVGDKVTAGQKLGVVGDYNPHWKAKGLGVLETGVFFSKKGSNAPWHACLSSFLDPTKKSAMLATLSSAFAAWEAELGDNTLYDEAKMSPVGCYTTAEMTDSNNKNTSNNGG